MELFYIQFQFFYLLLNRRFDLIYGRFLHGIYVATFLNKKVIYETHLPVSDKKDHRLIIFKRLIKSKYLIKMVVISKALKKIYLEKGFLHESKYKWPMMAQTQLKILTTESNF